MMLDEIDKLGRGIQGDPASALLEVLDPEQNSTFRDNYLGVPFDLSRVMFITTANVLDMHPRAAARPHGGHRPARLHRGREVRDRAALPGRPAARRPTASSPTGGDRPTTRCTRSSATTRARPACATSNARSARVLRSAAMKIAEGSATHVTIGADDLHEILGRAAFEGEVAMRTSIPGVATGLAWTPVGGDILFIEATRMPGKGGLILTGQLGEVMRESAQAALSLVKGKAAALGIDATLFEGSDIHVHVPAGAIPKDGPSRRGRDVHRARLAADRPHRQERHRDDRRDQPARAGIAGRRHQGEGRRGGARAGSAR